MSKWFKILLVFLLLILPISIAQAHELKIDKNINVIFHTDPDDHPISNAITKIFIEINDKTNKFKPELCNCTIAISMGANELLSKNLFIDKTVSNGEIEVLDYNFAKEGTYTITISGNPIPSDAFQSFKVSDDVEVSPNPNQNLWQKALVYLLPAVIVVIAAVYFFKKRRI